MGCPSPASYYLLYELLHLFDMMKSTCKDREGETKMEFFMQENGFSTTTEFGTLQISSEDTFGFRPYQLFVASMAVCSGEVLRKIMEKRRQSVKDIHIKADVTKSGVGANEIQKIHLHFVVEADNVTEEQMEKNMRLTRKNCSMVQSVKDSVEITETFELRQ